MTKDSKSVASVVGVLDSVGKQVLRLKAEDTSASIQSAYLYQISLGSQMILLSIVIQASEESLNES